MKKTTRIILAFLSGCAICAQTSASDRSSSIAITSDSKTLGVVNNDSRSVTLVDLDSTSVISEIMVGRDPQSISFHPQSSAAFVTNRFDDTVSVIDLFERRVVATIPVPDEPFGVVTASSGVLFVSCDGADTIEVIDVATSALLKSIKTGPRPRGLALSPDESLLYVTHFSTGRLSVIDTASLELDAVIETGLDHNLSNSIALNPDGSRAYLPQTRSNSSNPALLFDSTVFPIVSTIDLESGLNLHSERIHLDIADEPINMPFDSLLVGDQTLYVLNAGSNDISVIDLGSMTAFAHLEVGENPRGLVLSADQATLFVNNSLSGTITVIDTQNQQITNEIKVTEIALTQSLLNGKRLFHSTDRKDLAKDQWISCATCHFDGEMDGHTWFFPDGPRNTTSLLGVNETLAIHWSGDLDELQDVEITIRDIQAGTGLTDGGDNCDPACDQGPPNAGRSQDLDDLAAFMASLEFPPNPNLGEGGQRSEAAIRGKVLFESESTGCSACHIPPLYTDLAKHDVGTGAGSGELKGTNFNTPSLRGIYKTAPFLHDGSAETLLAVLTGQNPGDLHGATSHLTESELTDLVAFMASIGDEGSGFLISAGLNDAWFDPRQSGQGFLITVYPVIRQVFMAWFTYDAERPANDTPFNLGEAGHRWLTAQGSYTGNRAELSLHLTHGGVFGADQPKPVTDLYGTVTLEFTGCNSGAIIYDIPSITRQGIIPIERVVTDNVILCEGTGFNPD